MSRIRWIPAGRGYVLDLARVRCALVGCGDARKTPPPWSDMQRETGMDQWRAGPRRANPNTTLPRALSVTLTARAVRVGGARRHVLLAVEGASRSRAVEKLEMELQQMQQAKLAAV